MDCFCDYEGPEFYSQRTKTARVLHRCCECDHAIQPGEKYEFVAGKWGGYFNTHKTCNRCVSLRDHVAAHVRCFCFAHENLLDDVRETVRYLPSEAIGSGLLFELGRMAVAIKRAPTYRSLKP